MCKIDQTKGKLPGSRSFGSNWGPSVMPGNWVFPPHISRPTVNLIALIYGRPRGLPAESRAQERDQRRLREGARCRGQPDPTSIPLRRDLSCTEVLGSRRPPFPRAALLRAVPAQQEQCQGGKSRGERAGPTTVPWCSAGARCAHASCGLPSVLAWQRRQRLCASPPLFLIPRILSWMDRFQS